MAIKLRDYDSAQKRREALESELDISLPHISAISFDEQQACVKNCENMVGAISVPLGIAGPLSIKRSGLKTENYFLPLATTEGALVASVNRGCKAISESGGVTVIAKKAGITRAPVFSVKNVSAGFELIKKIDNHFSEIKVIAEKTSSHLKLLKITPWMSGRNVFMRFIYDSQDAMGMNMASIATQSAVDFIEEKFGVKCPALSGNMCVDKKPNFLNFIEGRGIMVWADVTIPKQIVTQVLKTSPQALYQTARAKIDKGSSLSGSIGLNAQYANILAAIFLATGQDIAHVAECSVGITEIELVDEDIYASVYLPDIVVGTVGGGTMLATQKESLSILGIRGGDNGKNSVKLSEIIAAAVLSGELSLLAALSSADLAKAHLKLGRGKP